VSESNPQPANQKVITTATGKSYTVKRPNIGESLSITNLQYRLLGGADVTKVEPIGRSMATMLATLKVVIVAPENLDFEETFQYEELMDVYTQYDEWMNTFFRSVKPSTSEGTGEE
jgi:hypothetical protein